MAARARCGTLGVPMCRPLGCAGMLFSGHKLYGPPVLAFSTVTSPDVIGPRRGPIRAGGENDRDRPAWTGSAYNEAPHKFEAGTAAAFLEADRLGRGDSLVSAIPTKREVQAHEHKLYQRARERMRSVNGP